MRLSLQLTTDAPPQFHEHGYQCPHCGQRHVSDDTHLWCLVAKQQQERNVTQPLTKLKLPKKGEHLIIQGPAGEQAKLRRCSDRRDWMLAKVGVTDHCRFGNAAEIRSDVQHFQLTGNLPRGEHW